MLSFRDCRSLASGAKAVTPTSTGRPKPSPVPVTDIRSKISPILSNGNDRFGLRCSSAGEKDHNRNNLSSSKGQRWSSARSRDSGRSTKTHRRAYSDFSPPLDGFSADKLRLRENGFWDLELSGMGVERRSLKQIQGKGIGVGVPSAPIREGVDAAQGLGADSQWLLRQKDGEICELRMLLLKEQRLAAIWEQRVKETLKAWRAKVWKLEESRNKELRSILKTLNEVSQSYACNVQKLTSRAERSVSYCVFDEDEEIDELIDGESTPSGGLGDEEWKEWRKTRRRMRGKSLGGMCEARTAEGGGGQDLVAQELLRQQAFNLERKNILLEREMECCKSELRHMKDDMDIVCKENMQLHGRDAQQRLEVEDAVRQKMEAEKRAEALLEELAGLRDEMKRIQAGHRKKIVDGECVCDHQVQSVVGLKEEYCASQEHAHNCCCRPGDCSGQLPEAVPRTPETVLLKVAMSPAAVSTGEEAGPFPSDGDANNRAESATKVVASRNDTYDTFHDVNPLDMLNDDTTHDMQGLINMSAGDRNAAGGGAEGEVESAWRFRESVSGSLLSLHDQRASQTVGYHLRGLKKPPPQQIHPPSSADANVDVKNSRPRAARHTRTDSALSVILSSFRFPLSPCRDEDGCPGIHATDCDSPCVEIHDLQMDPIQDDSDESDDGAGDEQDDDSLQVTNVVSTIRGLEEATTAKTVASAVRSDRRESSKVDAHASRCIECCSPVKASSSGRTEETSRDTFPHVECSGANAGDGITAAEDGTLDSADVNYDVGRFAPVGTQDSYEKYLTGGRGASPRCLVLNRRISVDDRKWARGRADMSASRLTAHQFVWCSHDLEGERHVAGACPLNARLYQQMAFYGERAEQEHQDRGVLPVWSSVQASWLSQREDCATNSDGRASTASTAMEIIVSPMQGKLLVGNGGRLGTAPDRNCLRMASVEDTLRGGGGEATQSLDKEVKAAAKPCHRASAEGGKHVLRVDRREADDCHRSCLGPRSREKVSGDSFEVGYVRDHVVTSLICGDPSSTTVWVENMVGVDKVAVDVLAGIVLSGRNMGRSSASSLLPQRVENLRECLPEADDRGLNSAEYAPSQGDWKLEICDDDEDAHHHARLPEKLGHHFTVEMSSEGLLLGPGLEEEGEQEAGRRMDSFTKTPDLDPNAAHKSGNGGTNGGDQTDRGVIVRGGKKDLAGVTPAESDVLRGEQEGEVVHRLDLPLNGSSLDRLVDELLAKGHAGGDRPSLPSGLLGEGRSDRAGKHVICSTNSARQIRSGCNGSATNPVNCRKATVGNNAPQPNEPSAPGDSVGCEKDSSPCSCSPWKRRCNSLLSTSAGGRAGCTTLERGVCLAQPSIPLHDRMGKDMKDKCFVLLTKHRTEEGQEKKADESATDVRTSAMVESRNGRATTAAESLPVVDGQSATVLADDTVDSGSMVTEEEAGIAKEGDISTEDSHDERGARGGGVKRGVSSARPSGRGTLTGRKKEWGAGGGVSWAGGSNVTAKNTSTRIVGTLAKGYLSLRAQPTTGTTEANGGGYVFVVKKGNGRGVGMIVGQVGKVANNSRDCGPAAAGLLPPAGDRKTGKRGAGGPAKRAEEKKGPRAVEKPKVSLNRVQRLPGTEKRGKSGLRHLPGNQVDRRASKCCCGKND
ncbi:hypothetical protein CBR_g5696 [Chara braunii]|uniref:Uncharacterized protein n=1 Tax=Chara braunii TaxID=69332 RepID=A0A388JRU5_CHABU|nr:hypothetical protein CBR_g5696 [Chara braunii]|eukprot:GBG60521.1 hypothetical protein CBR_g5696 [Chara braunii]